MSGPGVAILADGVGKLYRRTAPGASLRTLKSALLDRSLTKGLTPEESIAALSDVSFTVDRGEAFGLVGGNGSGKSTMLKILAGILKPSSGRVMVDGRVAALIELGAGFHPEISGRENVFINGSLLGLSRAEIIRRLDDIIEFSGLEDFIDEPVKNYSSGMYVRLGFSVAVHTDPDILLVDEVLAVGDEAFGHRCLRRIEELLSVGRTILFVSHSLDLVEHLCDRALWLEGGHARLLGEPRRVIDAYRQAVAEQEERELRAENEERRREDNAASTGLAEPSASPAGSEAEAPGTTDTEARWGSRVAEIRALRLLDSRGDENYAFRVGEDVVFEIEASTEQELRDFVFGVKLATPRGLEVWGTNTDLGGLVPERFVGTVKVRLECPGLRLQGGDYTVDVAVHAKDGAPYDYRVRMVQFRVDPVPGDAGGIGVYAPAHRWGFAGSIEMSHETDRGPSTPSGH